MRHLLRWLSLALLPALSLGCGGGGDNRLNVGGATFIYPMMDKWSVEYDCS